ncbi:MAG: DUF1579 family protein [Bacteroidetes bacterium]|nr:DUF1579 family protein [Bacteroidota bacterium]
MRRLVTSAALFLTFCFCSVPAFAQEGMEEYMKLMGPGPEHEILKKMVGSWNLKISFWQMPGADPVTTEGTSENRLILGGRFLQMESQSGEGETYMETLNILGFDRRHEKYTTVGFDTWGTYYVTATGDYDEAKKTLTYYGEDDDPVMGFTQKYRYIVSWLSDDSFRMEIIFIDFPMVQEKEWKMVEILYTRK